MTSDSGLTSQDSDYARHIQEVLNELRQMQQTPRLVTSPDALEALERAMRQRPDRLGSFLVGHHLQQALDSAALQAEQAQLVSHWPQPLKNDGKVEVRDLRINTIPPYVGSITTSHFGNVSERFQNCFSSSRTSWPTPIPFSYTFSTR